MRSVIRFLRPVLAILLMSSLVFATTVTVAAQEEDNENQEQEQNGQQQEATIDDVLSNPDGYVNQTVTVSGTVDDFISSRAFTVTNDEADDSILVIGSADVFPNDLYDDTPVQVTGTVRIYDPSDPAEFDPSEIGVDLEDDAFSEFEDDPVLVADSIGTDADTDDAATDDEPATIPTGDIIADPDFFTGQTVTVTAEIGDILDPQSFTLENDSDFSNLLVIGTANMMPGHLSGDAIVRVQGTVHFFDPTDDLFSEDADEIGIDPEDDIYRPYSNSDPVIIADSVKLVAPELGAQIDEILENEDEWMGQTVTVLGRVNESLTVQAFTYEGTDGFLGITSEDLLVIGAQDMMPTDGLVEDAIVQVSGTVVEFDPVDEFETEDDSFVLENEDDEVYDDFEGDAAIAASSVNVLATETGETVEAILDDEEGFVGQTVTVAGQIDTALTADAFTLEGTEGIFGLSDENLLVIGATDTMTQGEITEEAIVVVTGTAELFDPNATYEINGEEVVFDDGLFDDFEGDSVIVAESTNILAVD